MTSRPGTPYWRCPHSIPLVFLDPIEETCAPHQPAPAEPEAWDRGATVHPTRHSLTDMRLRDVEEGGYFGKRQQIEFGQSAHLPFERARIRRRKLQLGIDLV